VFLVSNEELLCRKPGREGLKVFLGFEAAASMGLELSFILVFL